MKKLNTLFHSLKFCLLVVPLILLLSSCNIFFKTSLQNREQLDLLLKDSSKYFRKMNGFGGFVNDAKIYGEYAFVAKGYKGLEVYDISDPANMFPINHVETTNAISITLSKDGRRLFLSDDLNGLIIFDISNPLSIREISKYSIIDENLKSVTLSLDESTAFLAYDDIGVYILDISDINNPMVLSSYDTSGNAYKVAIVPNSDYVLVADGNNSLVSLNISDLSTPVYGANLSLIGKTVDIEVLSDGSRALVSNNSSGITVVDLTNLSANSFSYITFNLQAGSSTNDIKLSNDDNYLYVADNGNFGLHGLSIYDISNLGDVTIVKDLDMHGNPLNIDIDPSENVAIVSVEQNGLVAVDLSNFPTSISELSTYKTISKTWSIELSDDEKMAWIRDDNFAIVQLDLSDEKNLKVFQTFRPNSIARAFTTSIDKHYAYYSDISNAFKVIDYNDPANPIQIGSKSLGNTVNFIKRTLNPNYILVSTNIGVQVADVTNPDVPTVTPNISLGASFSLEISGNGQTVFVANRTSGINIIDISAIINGSSTAQLT